MPSFATLCSELDDKKNVINMLKTELTHLQQALTVCKAESAFCKLSDACSYARKIDALEQRLSNLGKEKEADMMQIEKLNKSLDEAKKATKAAELKALNAAKELAAAAEAARAQDAERVLTINETAAAAARSDTTLKKQLLASQQENETLKKNVYDVKMACAAKLNERSRQSLMSKTTMQLLRQTNLTLKQSLADANENVAELKVSAQLAANELHKLRIYAADMQDDQKRKKRRTEEEKEAVKLRMQIEALEKSLNEATNNAKVITEEKQELEEQAVNMKLSIEALKKSLFHVTTAGTELQQRLDEATDNVAAITRAKEEAEKQRKAADASYSNLMKQKVLDDKAVKANTAQACDAAVKAAELKGQNAVKDAVNAAVKDAETHREGLCSTVTNMRKQIEKLQQ